MAEYFLIAGFGLMALYIIGLTVVVVSLQDTVTRLSDAVHKMLHKQFEYSRRAHLRNMIKPAEEE